MRIHLEDAAALRNAFAEAVALQLASVPSGPLGQRGFIFPFEGPHCLVYLQQTQHLPAVCKLLRLAHQHTACSLATLNARHAAPLACFLAGLAAVEEHRAVHGLPAVQGMTACCGFGASEYAAAVFAGVLRLNDALTALKVQMDALKLGKPLPDVVAAVHNALELADIRSPRVSLYSGASAAACSDTATLRWVLARAACSGPPSHEHRRQVCTALMQQGVAELVSLVPPKRDRMGDGRGEAQQSGDRERNSDSAGAVLDSVLACMSTSSESSTSESALEAVEGYTTS